MAGCAGNVAAMMGEQVMLGGVTVELNGCTLCT